METQFNVHRRDCSPLHLQAYGYSPHTAENTRLLFSAGFFPVGQKSKGVGHTYRVESVKLPLCLSWFFGFTQRVTWLSFTADITVSNWLQLFCPRVQIQAKMSASSWEASCGYERINNLWLLVGQTLFSFIPQSFSTFLLFQFPVSPTSNLLSHPLSKCQVAAASALPLEVCAHKSGLILHLSSMAYKSSHSQEHWSFW